MRAGLSSVALLPGEEMTSLYRALLLGDRRGLTQDLRDAFADSGTAHLLAISGLHLAVIGFGVFRLLCWALAWIPWLVRRVPVTAVAGLAAMGVIWTYVGAIETSEATLRATAAFSLLACLLYTSPSPRDRG